MKRLPAMKMYKKDMCAGIKHTVMIDCIDRCDKMEE